MPQLLAKSKETRIHLVPTSAPVVGCQKEKLSTSTKVSSGDNSWPSFALLTRNLQEHPNKTPEEHRKAGEAFLKLPPDKKTREDFMKARYTDGHPCGFRYSALNRLPYWDGARMSIVDPMHCLFLGQSCTATYLEQALI